MDTRRPAHALRNTPRHSELHRAVYAALLISVLWIVAVCWILFSKNLYAGLQVGVVTMFAAAFVATPVALWKVSGRKDSEETLSFRDWADGELDTIDGSVKARHAVVMILLAPAACAIGLTAIGIVARLAAAGAL